MKKYHCYSAEFDVKTERLFKEAKYLGQGNNGIVYSLPEGKVIKLFIEEKVWRDEAEILLKVNDSKYFPTVYSVGKMYIVREIISGIQLDKYIKKNGINYDVVYNIYLLIKEFKKLKFTKIDTRCKDLYIDTDYSIRVIDPKKCYKRNVSYPRHLMKGMLKHGVLGEFMYFMKQIDYQEAEDWEKRFSVYWEKERKKKRHKNK